jgi:hypothetical protein
MKDLDDLKREVWETLGDEHHLVAQELTLRAVIDYLHAQGRIVPDGYVAVPIKPTTDILKAMSDFDDDAPWIDLWEAALAAAQEPQVNIGVNVGGYVTEGYQSHTDAQNGGQR